MRQDEPLHLLTRAIEAAHGTDPEAARWLADGLALVQAGAARSLDIALQIRGRGISSLETRERLARRDRHVCRAFTLIAFSESTTTTSRVRELASELVMFEQTSWRWSRDHAQPPARLTPLQVELWHALQCGPVPTSRTSLTRIVSSNADREMTRFHG
ncbi:MULTISPECIES: hypothetical protein [unclassified Thiocapsa]|uniref:hypothetical protein n=1 Tax=unclassified Thiocapsa TaxID=2641286 RepID=UPI0035AF3E88